MTTKIYNANRFAVSQHFIAKSGMIVEPGVAIQLDEIPARALIKNLPRRAQIHHFLPLRSRPSLTARSA
ncbi:hypothetical protein SAMN06297251_1449 [Fulvimarina manganoxydans]|uniref:Uncharacterized protein n=1 Tax=Fulvimarina manganoxydans TaxID=937218 RepID=A0A1W2F0F6_9HYPH|nr:hypothetical protein SAMN06297251_1449 [Fulvimarina manganoxydans]